jgi:cathepsin L
MKVAVFALLGLVAFASALTEKEYQTAFTTWARENSKSYAHDQFLPAYRTFKANHQFIEQWNARVAAGEQLHTVALNKFADLTAEQFSKMYKGLNVKTVPAASTQKVAVRPDAPASVDWSTTNNPAGIVATTPVKNQQQCGSCWSFSTTGSTEGCHAVKAHASNPTGLSEQNLVDCSDNQGNQGCDGGLMTQAMDYIISNGGIDTEASYPYTAQDGTCQYNPANSGGTLSSYTNVQSGSEEDLQNKVTTAPVSIAIDASHSSFQFYSSGIYVEPDCSSSQLDHGVLAAGYGSLNGKAYWRVKNSWGTDWGLSGYILMARNADNQCGVATMATIPSC